jgi:cob(I)alamin adenosyltransferase
MKGYTQIYTGNGKGKTTAAMGLAIRAAGAGMNVFIGQFIKGMHYHELDSLAKVRNIKVKQYGLDCFIINHPTEEDMKAARQGFIEAVSIINDGDHELVILDEINIAVHYGLITVKEMLKLMADKPAHVELVLTGRYAHEDLIGAADLVSEIRETKHYYQNGIEARKGIEY